MRLSELEPGIPATIDQVEDREDLDPVADRLRALGFVPGEPVQVVAVGPLGGDPIAVRIGFTRFALRRAEANRIVLDDRRT
ncbi:ferrous iron transport protein A [Ameyamaea chiangmaiensis NBRC 103196]|uniref:Ferrous iron transport protein A n=1 Tax=Ameyamaea chiangmaiensis TaxID=442969 RepID=A0A850PE71_9PROT|nr:FeoA family protein [Ameyamaea chiangmaiensis]MBS4074658.1 ferrous iron transport protein A [Ameyamaea chiangmaiensis]NVN40770.1 ferrous iron transport protein A [Ameyamaea chiangmaiensis]GBQ65018.1 ferrous iron transport protein A [Ameyamaea chiangmaiensis NBRC 103196]